jgi:hypothetical protein
MPGRYVLAILLYTVSSSLQLAVASFLGSSTGLYAAAASRRGLFIFTQLIEVTFRQ